MSKSAALVHLTFFVKKHNEAIFHVRETADRDGRFRIYFEVKDAGEVEPWEKDDVLLEENLESILGATVDIGVGTANDLIIFRHAARGSWVTIAMPDLFVDN